jgi:ribosomal protein S18 acetylase RimI-like enzyme
VESVRAATTDDLAHVVTLVDEFVTEQRSLRGGPVWASLEGPRLQPEAVAAAVEESTTPDGSHVVLLGCIDESVVGLAVVAIEDVLGAPPLAVIRVLHVHADAREVGVGSALLDAVSEVAIRRGCSGIDATVLPGNREAKNFFEMHGLVARAISVHRSVGERP